MTHHVIARSSRDRTARCCAAPPVSFMLGDMRRAAFFDLDGTLLTANSAALWLRRERRLGRLRKRDMAIAALYLSAYKFSLVDMERAIGQAVATLRGQSETELRDAMTDFYREELSSLAAPGARAAIERHRERGDALVVLTSSALYLAEAAREQFGLDDVLCTRWEVSDGALTGELHPPACYGAGKVLHAEAYAREHGIDLASSAFYTDSLTDLPMLLRVGEPVAVNPDPRLRFVARRKGWPVVDWRRQPPSTGTG